MALSNQTDPRIAEQQLSRWLAARFPEAIDPQVTGAVIPSDAGLSTETIVFDAEWSGGDGTRTQHQLVARVQPSGEAVFMSYDLEAEARVLQALGAKSPVPVPTGVVYESDPDILGAPFLVMERLDGRVPSDDPPFTADPEGWVLRLTAARRAMLYDNALEVIADIHAVDYERAGLSFLAEREPGEPGLDQQLGYWERFYAWAAAGETNPTIEAGLDWIHANRPQGPEPLVLNWGDARPGNMLFRDDMAISGVLDWEMVTVASPEMDLGWWLLLLRHHTEGIGAPLPSGFPNREATIARYEELTGHPVQYAEFYEAFAALRLSVLMHRAGRLMIGAGLLPPDAPMKLNNPATQLLAKLAGLPAPDGAAQSFIGNR
jgi:aminoglycoside phosphotransferase (APT) family kinase protein